MGTTSVSKTQPVVRRLAIWTILLLLGLILAAGAFSQRQAPPASLSDEEQQQVMISQAAFEEATGVHIVRVALTAMDGMIDLRYQVIDPDKAVIIHEAANPPAIMDEATGTILDTPWMNHAHGGDFQAGVSYYMLLMNSGSVLTRGSKVTIILGGVRLEHVIVQ